jgi:antirestriction protein ArdC
VFNAEQIDGLPPLQVQAKAPDGDRHARAAAVLAASGADIRHDQSERAFYRPATDRIHLPERDRFQSEDTFYACALHELGHWTGHPTRLGRDLAHPFGSEGYAREELRAAIASLAIGERLGIGHDPGQHAAYVERWVKVLQDDPREILRAARDADKIGGYILGREKDRPAETIERSRQIDPAPPPHAERPPSARAGRER